MKILICGKGGCGKSTIVALLAKELALRGNRVLVIDTDESNVGLHNHLGMDKPKDFMNYFGGKKLLFEKTKELTGRWRSDDLPADYLTSKGNIRLLSMGKIYQFGEGCACPINALASRFLEILDLRDNEILIADTDAGIEHFGRGVEKGVDTLLVVIEPSLESILLAKKISELGWQADKAVYYVLNRITDRETQGLLMNAMGKERVVAIIPVSREIFLSGLSGNELSTRVEGIQQIADMLQSIRKSKGRPLKGN